MNRVLVTGATGFVGHALTLNLIHRVFNVVASVRKISPRLPAEVRQDVVGELGVNADWSEALQNVISGSLYTATIPTL